MQLKGKLYHIIQHVSNREIGSKYKKIKEIKTTSQSIVHS